MQANDLITQVHSEEDDNGHHEHLADHDSAAQSQTFWQKFLGCLLCRSKTASPSAGNKSNIYSKHASVPLQPQNTHLNNANSVNNSNATPAAHVTTTTTVTKTIQNAPMPSIPLTSPPQPAVQMNGAPPSKYLLPPLPREEVMSNKKTLVLDLDETLVHSSFKPIPNADFVLSIDLEGVIHRVSDKQSNTQRRAVVSWLHSAVRCLWLTPGAVRLLVRCCVVVVSYVRKRPGVDHFLRYCAEKFEVVVFTASLAKYADPLLDILDRDHTVRVRLFREACVQHYGNYVKVRISAHA